MMIILIGDYFITSQVFNLVFWGSGGVGGGEYEINTVVIVPYIKTQKNKAKRTWPIFRYLDLTLG